MGLLNDWLDEAVKNSYEKNKRKEPSFLDALRDPQFQQDVKRGVLDSVNRGAIASTIGGPVDLATMVMRLGGYNVEKPIGGSEWVGDKMQQMGLLGDYRNPVAEGLASVAVPAGMAKVAPKVFQAEQAAIKNAQAEAPMNTAMRGQFGGVKVGEKFQYPQEAALATAQRNAALPVSDGGLGLHPNNTPMERAAALKVDLPVYRGTSADEVSHNGNVWVTDEPKAADYYTGYVNQDEVYPMLPRHEGGNVMPLLGSRDVIHSDNGSELWNGGNRFHVPASTLRSRFAAFDPARINENDLLAGAMPFGLLADPDLREMLGQR